MSVLPHILLAQRQEPSLFFTPAYTDSIYVNIDALHCKQTDTLLPKNKISEGLWLRCMYSAFDYICLHQIVALKAEILQGQTISRMLPHTHHQYHQLVSFSPSHTHTLSNETDTCYILNYGWNQHPSHHDGLFIYVYIVCLWLHYVFVFSTDRYTHWLATLSRTPCLYRVGHH